MYCQKCGKEITENSVFCTWCGTRQELPASQPAPADVIGKSSGQADVVTETTAAVQSVESAETLEKTEKTDEPAISGEKITENAAESVEKVPEHSFSGEIPMEEKPKNPEKPHKYYTTAHLVICLAAAGIMAATAGVFAGLYFSVIA